MEVRQVLLFGITAMKSLPFVLSMSSHDRSHFDELSANGRFY